MAKTRFKVSVALSADLVKRLDGAAEALGVSRSALIQQLCEDGMAEVELSAKVFSDPVLSGAMLSAFSQPGVIRSMMGVMKEELTSEQLDLFAKSMTAAAGAVLPPAPDKPKPLAKRRRPSRKGKGE